MVEGVPEGWGSDGLSSFIEGAKGNAYATFANLRVEWVRLEDIDRLFQRIVENLSNPPDPLAPFFLQRAHSAYRGAVRLVVSGQLPETYAVLRTSLEWALSALSLEGNRSDAEVWLRRQEDEQTWRRVRRRFTIDRMMELLTEKANRLGGIVRELYERCIDFGAQPNELALTTNGSMTRGASGDLVFNATYLSGLSVALRLGIKTTAQVGVGTLEVFGLVFPERFDLLSISAGLEDAKRGL